MPLSMNKGYKHSDKQQDKSNVLFLLQSIERIFNLCQDVLNTYAQKALMLSLAIESHMLLLKLRVMRERWHYHLPFKEASKVDFEEWGRKIKKMGQYFDASGAAEDSEPISEYCPSKHFLLDLYDTLPENTEAEGHNPYYKETVISHFLDVQDKMRQDITDQWLSYYKQRFSDHVVSDLESTEGLELSLLRDDDEAIIDACHDVQLDLSAELYKLSDLTEPDILPEHFARLAERVFSETEYAGHDARKSARHDVKEWKNKTPKRRREVSRKGEIEASVKIISEMRYGHVLAEFIGEDYEIKGHDEGLGQFLHRVRKHITTSDLADLMEQLYRIRFFRENKEQEDAAEAAKVAAATIPANQDNGKPTVKKIPRRPKLDSFFRKELAGDADATSSFYDILHRTERYMDGRFTEEEKAKLDDTKIYKKWKWNHLRVAFEKAGFTEKGTAKQSFAEYIEKVFPYHNSQAIIRSIQRHNENTPGFDNIVKEVIYEFKDIQEMIEE